MTSSYLIIRQWQRIISELKNVAKDVDGDVVAIGKNYLFVTPSGIKIDRNKIRVK